MRVRVGVRRACEGGGGRKFSLGFRVYASRERERKRKRESLEKRSRSLCVRACVSGVSVYSPSARGKKSGSMRALQYTRPAVCVCVCVCVLQ